jgi:cytochrome b561
MANALKEPGHTSDYASNTSSKDQTMQKTVITRILHAALAVAIVHQLVTSLFMERPRPGGSSGNFAFEFHEAVGLASLGLLALFWLWTVVRRGETQPGALFPWLSAERRRRVFADIRSIVGGLVRRRFPPLASEMPLASAVHGLGLLVATAMATTGAIVYATMGADGSLPTGGKFSLELHEVFANLMWAYLIGHAGMAVLHDMAGHRVLGRMFLGQE